MKPRIALIATHPIQYNVPYYVRLTERGNINLKVFYTYPQAQNEYADVEFGKRIEWDIPLLEGYNFEFIENSAKKPSLKSFLGIHNPKLIDKIKAYRPSAILINGWNFRSHLGTMRYFKGKIPIYFRGDSTLLDEYPGWKQVARRSFLKWLYTNVDKALYVGEHNKEYYKAHGLTNRQLLKVPHAIDTNRFQTFSKADEQSLERLRDQAGLKKSDFVFIYIGKFIKKKNPKLLLSAFKAANFPDHVKLLYVGNGELEEELKAESKQLKNIIFLPFQNQKILPLVYRLGDCLVLPSKGPGETWGLVVNEAQACGLSTIISDKVGCAPDMIQPAYHDVVFRYNDESELVNVLKNQVQKGKLNHRPVKDEIAELCLALEQAVLDNE
jgi:glycosyltransferase involved in cell wall biosynthesis